MSETTKDLADIAEDVEEYVSVYMSRTEAAKLIGTIVVANMVTILVCGAVARWGKNAVAKRKLDKDQQEVPVGSF
jgi:uncharacterized protein YejL (UPF0352 family)